MSINFSICVPSRGRPSELNRMINSALSLAKHPNGIEILVFSDSDDESMTNFSGKNCRVFKGARKSVSEMTNILASKSTGQVIMYGADDIVFRTKHWDDLILLESSKSQSKFYLIYGDDLGQNSNKIATHGFVSRELYLNLGYLLTHRFNGDFCDTWITDIVNRAGCKIFLADLIIEHMHPTWGKAEKDATYRSSNLILYLLKLVKFKVYSLERIQKSRRLRASINAESIIS